MTATASQPLTLPKIVSPAEWQKARDTLLLKEKAATKARDALAAERRRLPMVRIDKNYTFAGPTGTLTLRDLFAGRRQLLLYHFMFAPPVAGWPDAGCVGCSMMADNFGNISHLHARDTSFCMVSLAPLNKIQSFQKRMGWTYPWYSSAGTDFNKDFGRTTDKGELYGLSVFLHDDHHLYRTYFTDGRGFDGIPIWTLLDLTPFGRQEDWEDSPAGRPKTQKFTWWKRHDEYPQESAGQQP